MINGHSEAYIRAAVEGEVGRMSAAQAGERNNRLYRSAASLAGLGLREGQIIHYLKPVAEGVGLRGKEFYSTIKSAVKTGHAAPRVGPYTNPVHSPVQSAISTSGLPRRSFPDNEGRAPAFFSGGEDGPRKSPDEIRRHVYHRDGVAVRVKIKRLDGFVNWYRVADGSSEGWQAGKPQGYAPCPYVGAVNPFDPELIDDVIYWPEGEKDCDSLGSSSFPAFTFGGTGDGVPEGIQGYLLNRHVVILADNDSSGRDHANKKAVLACNFARSVKIVEFAELQPGGDVSDFLKVNSPEALENRVNQIGIWTPPSTATDATNASEGAASLIACTLSDVAPEKIEWLWPDRIAIGKITMIGGEPGLGKSQVSIAIAAAVTTGGSWPLGTGRAPSGSVVILSAEDGLADTVRPRFDAAGGDASKVRIVRAVQSTQQGGRRTFNLLADLALLEREITSIGDVRLVLIDPVSSYLGKIDSHKNADVRSVLEPLGDMAERLRVAVVTITHLSKGDGKAINRFMGSIAFVAAARTAFAVVADAEDESRARRFLLPVKNNIASQKDGLAFHLAQRLIAEDVIGSYVVWDESAGVSISVDQALAARSGGDETTAKDAAIEFLGEVLSSGPVDVLDIEAEARAATLLSDGKRLNACKPFRTAAAALGIEKQRIGFGPGARVRWSLPASADERDPEARYERA